MFNSQIIYTNEFKQNDIWISQVTLKQDLYCTLMISALLLIKII